MKYNFCPDIRGFLSAFEAIHLKAWFPAMGVDWENFGLPVWQHTIPDSGNRKPSRTGFQPRHRRRLAHRKKRAHRRFLQSLPQETVCEVLSFNNRNHNDRPSFFTCHSAAGRIYNNPWLDLVADQGKRASDTGLSQRPFSPYQGHSPHWRTRLDIGDTCILGTSSSPAPAIRMDSRHSSGIGVSRRRYLQPPHLDTAADAHRCFDLVLRRIIDESSWLADDNNRRGGGYLDAQLI